MTTRNRSGLLDLGAADSVGPRSFLGRERHAARPACPRSPVLEDSQRGCLLTPRADERQTCSLNLKNQRCTLGIGMHGEEAVKQFLEQFPLPKFSALQNESDVPGVDETVKECLDKVFSSRYGASLLPSYGAFIQAGLVANSKNIRKLACKAVCHLLGKAGDSSVAVETVVQHNLYPLLIDCLLEGDEETSAIVLDAIKCLAVIPKGSAWIRVLSLIAKLFTVSSYTATAIRDSNLLNIFEGEIRDRKDVLKTLSALEVLYEVVLIGKSHFTIPYLFVDLSSDSSADSIMRSRAALISGRLLSSADAFTVIDQSCFFGSICGVDRQEDHMKLDGQAEECLKRLVYIAAANSLKLRPSVSSHPFSALLLSVLQQDPDIRIAGYRVISGLVVRDWCLREVCSDSEIIRLVTDPIVETTKLGMEAWYNCRVAINKALSSSCLLHEASLSELIGKAQSD
ncbi:hypothetical protein PR202_ga10672 [Eleusine coracana subsp. coracana]|uniref:ARM repeat superfamily protein n=1 Tax=Eleusine coracana subsp. coracana TaxID=191504 RepID=A0AAV5C7G2_ELECO|nr:hypothetical protein PR202_ga10672 [Eleusine coracana subsp. coracana]